MKQESRDSRRENPTRLISQFNLLPSEEVLLCKTSQISRRFKRAFCCNRLYAPLTLPTGRFTRFGFFSCCSPGSGSFEGAERLLMLSGHFSLAGRGVGTTKGDASQGGGGASHRCPHAAPVCQSWGRFCGGGGPEGRAQGEESTNIINVSKHNVCKQNLRSRSCRPNQPSQHRPHSVLETRFTFSNINISLLKMEVPKPDTELEFNGSQN